jgi:hypothetical protein
VIWIRDEVSHVWRGSIADAEMVDFMGPHGGRAALGWRDRIQAHSPGWVAARDGDGLVVGFVKVA